MDKMLLLLFRKVIKRFYYYTLRRRCHSPGGLERDYANGEVNSITSNSLGFHYKSQLYIHSGTARGTYSEQRRVLGSWSLLPDDLSFSQQQRHTVLYRRGFPPQTTKSGIRGRATQHNTVNPGHHHPTSLFSGTTLQSFSAVGWELGYDTGRWMMRTAR